MAMVKRKAVQGLMVLTAMLGMTSGGQARDLLGNVQADVFVLGGGSTFVDAHYFAESGSVYHSRFDLGTKWTVGVAVPYGKLLSIETAFTTGPNNLWLTNVNRFPHVGVEYPSRTYIGSLSAVVHAPFSRFHFRPYGAAGVEYDRFSPTAGAIATAKQGFGSASTALLTHNDKFGISLGCGLTANSRNALPSALTFGITSPVHPRSAFPRRKR